MTNKEYNEYKELGEMLDDADDENVALTQENSELKDLLISALLELGKYQRENIGRLLDIDNEFEDDEEICDCRMCNQ